MRTTLLLCIYVFFSDALWSQPTNDECLFAIHIQDVEQYCSNDGEFTNVGATPETMVANTCFLNFRNGVWFSFIPKKPAVLIKVLGQGFGGTIRNPQIVLFSACGQYLQCSPGKDTGTDELTQTGLVIGQRYYIMIESPEGQEGRFGLCIDDFFAPRSPESDCIDAVVLCDKSPFSIENLNSVGNDRNEVAGSCIQEEFASAWYVWTCDEPGTLTFDLIPNNFIPGRESDDLDFAVYELPGGIRDCANKRLIRCMASGANVGQPFSAWERCNGPTGLRDGETRTEEFPGCGPGDNNYVAPIQMQAGMSYALIINNFSRSGLGFTIEFGGTGTFLGPEPDFDLSAVQAFECDKTIVFENLSNSETDPIVSYSWNFGVGSTPVFIEGEGPHDVIYESFGDKLAALTVETSRGCQVSKVIEFFVEPCCADTSTLAIEAHVIDVNCGGDASGEIIGIGRSGAPQYAYSLDGINFGINPRFRNLGAGVYEIFIQDQKGCINRIDVVVDEPPPLRAFITRPIDTATINLGETIQIESTYEPSTSNVTVRWIPPDSLSCVDCFNPMSRTPGTTTYILEIEDEAGCIARDTITIFVRAIREVFAPNIFSPDGDGNNDFFGLFGGLAVSVVDELMVYDRWGNLMYRGRGLPLNEYNNGWDGTYGGRFVNPGVYTWIAKVRFIDGVQEVFTGDITVIR